MIDTLATREWIFDLLIKFDFLWLDVPDVAIWGAFYNACAASC